MEIEPHMSLLTFPNSGNTYYFRRKIPTDLIEHFGGLKEFRISLKCAIKSRSIRTTKILDQKVSGIFEEGGRRHYKISLKTNFLPLYTFEEFHSCRVRLSYPVSYTHLRAHET